MGDPPLFLGPVSRFGSMVKMHYSNLLDSDAITVIEQQTGPVGNAAQAAEMATESESNKSILMSCKARFTVNIEKAGSVEQSFTWVCGLESGAHPDGLVWMTQGVFSNS